MGGWDVYCAICGSITIDKYGWDDDETEERIENSDAHPPEDTSWLADIRIIGENPESSYPNKVYIGKTTRYDDWGYFDEVEGGDDPCFFSDSPRSIRVYDFEGDDSLAVPVHSACLELLQAILRSEDIDREVLYEILKALCSTENYKALDLDYGTISEHQDQYWSPIRAPEAFEALPTSIPRLSQYYNALPTTDGVEHYATKTNDTKPLPNDEPFGRLPVELLLLVMSNLDMSSVPRFRCASRAASRVVLGNSFWRARVRDHMPWLHDLPGLDDEEVAGAIHWAKVYSHLLRASEPSSESRIRGLVNRRRIWQISRQIAKLYLVNKTRKTAMSKDGETESLESAMSSALWRLTMPDATKTESAKICLLKRFEDLVGIEPKLVVHWTETGNLAGLGVRTGNLSSGTDANNVVGREESFSRSDDVLFPGDDWITGLIITSEECVHSENLDLHVRSVIGLEVLFAKQNPVQLGKANGDKRVIHVSDGKFVVGFIGNWCPDEGVVSKLSILEQPASQAPYAAMRRITDRHYHEYSAQMTSYLWKYELPPPVLAIPPYESGYWSWDMKADVSPMEALVLGTSDAELTGLRAISADVQFGGFELRYADGTTRGIGPRCHAMKRLTIDGAGGERVASMYLYVDYLPNGLRFVTNRGRQLVVGHARGEETRYLPSSGSGSNDDDDDDGKKKNGEEALAGFYGFWSDRLSVKTRLEAVGPLYLDSSDNRRPGDVVEGEGEGGGGDDDTSTDDGPRDTHGFPWEPSLPPAEMSAPVGPIWGEREYPERWTQKVVHSPARGCWVTWLDFRRPVVEIRAVLCHGVSGGNIPLVGISVRYGDGSKEDSKAEVEAEAEDGNNEQSSIGPRDLEPPTDTQGANGFPWCWCELGDKREGELESRPHYVRECWRPGGGGGGGIGMRMRSMRVWIDGAGCLAGLQFTAAAGGDDDGDGGSSSEGPVWGYTEGREATGEIRFGDGEVSGSGGGSGEAAGIKFYMGDNGRNATRCDTVVVGVQALTRGGGVREG